MTKPNLALLLAAWCGLAVLPGVLTATLLGATDLDEAMRGPVALAWLVGYLAQLALWYVIARKAKSANMFGWFMASLAPWVGCLAAAASPWWLLACSLTVAGFAVGTYRRQVGLARVQEFGVPAIGTVLDVVTPRMNVVVDNAYLERTLRLRVERSDGEAPYEANYRGTWLFGEIPSAGMTLRLRIDPRHPHRLLIDDHARTTDGRRRIRRPGRNLDAIATELGRLAARHRRGELTDEEYAAAKRKARGS